jgi:NitT/TauT family transport system substrate-binding protein
VRSLPVCKQGGQRKPRLDLLVDMAAADIVLSGQSAPMKTRPKYMFARKRFSRLHQAIRLACAVCLSIVLASDISQSNPYLAKPGETPITAFVATCATSGGFIHLYTMFDQNILAKYGIAAKHIVIRTGTNINLAALGSDEIQFLYCAGDSTIPGIAAGADATIVASPLVGLPYVIIARKEIKTIQDLKGKSIGVGSVGGLPFRLLKAFTKKFGLEETQIRPVGGSQPERYAAMLHGIIDSGPFTPPMDARGRKDGFNIVYHLNDLGLPAIYSSLHTNAKTIRERHLTVQRFVAALAEAVHFVEANPEKAKASVAKALKVQDEDVLQSSYDAYAKKLINRRLVVPVNAVSESVDVAREAGTKVTKKATDLFDNSFADSLEKTGFLRELWGGKVP